MATTTQNSEKTGVGQDARQGVKSLIGFFNKFNNDWVMNFASALAFNLISAILPILIAILAVAGHIIGPLDPTSQTKQIAHLNKNLQ